MKTSQQAKLVLVLIFAFIIPTSASATVSINKVKGWFESGYVEWTPLQNAQSYDVYYKAEGEESWNKLDKELVRNYVTYGRADVVGLKVGTYRFKVVPVINGEPQTAEATITDTFTTRAYDRSGFAHQGMTTGVGAYNNDGTLKADAKVIYVHANNAKTVKTSIFYDKAEKEFIGLQAICHALEKGTEKAPICIRIIGTIKDADMDYFASSEEGLQIKGRDNTRAMNITLEGIGNDATLWGFGILLSKVWSAELRNFAVMLCMDDAVSINNENKNIWVHNMDFFYGKPGKDADQVKGDGTVDTKSMSTHTTIAYNHYFDNGKVNLGGMKSETTSCVHTYHHNWYDHCDSRMPRIRTMSFHIYNNYYDGISKYGVGMTCGGSAFVERNYFRNCKNPMLVSKQGTDAKGSGTFDDGIGGVIKAFDNIVKNEQRLIFIDSKSADADITAGDWDAYNVATADETVPAKVTCLAGGTGYNNFDTNGTIAYQYTSDATADVPTIVMSDAGRIDGGDFKWQFDNAKQDENDGIITNLKNELTNYTSSLKDFFDGITNNNYGQTTRSGGDAEKHPDYIPSWAGGKPAPEKDNEIYSWTGKIGTTEITSKGETGKISSSSVNIYKNTTSVKGLKFEKSMTLNAETSMPEDYYITITPQSGYFNIGDTLYIAGAYNNKEQKKATIKILNAEGDSIFNTQPFINGRLVDDEPVIEKYILEKENPCLYLGRNGNTATFITTLQVCAKTSTGIEEIGLSPKEPTPNPSLKGREIGKTNIQGIKVNSLSKGVIIKNGKKYLQ
ncbi:MAG: pectate lyase [Prevotella sp.]|nr:pectate lyase [Candidatus Equicola stercoris]